jgi:hypothetical protein
MRAGVVCIFQQESGCLEKTPESGGLAFSVAELAAIK